VDGEKIADATHDEIDAFLGVEAKAFASRKLVVDERERIVAETIVQIFDPEDYSRTRIELPFIVKTAADCVAKH
jgi:hypothetical protein